MSRPSPFEMSTLYADRNIANAFERIAATYPQNLAVHHDGEVFTYAEINAKADAVAALLDQTEAHEAPTVIFFPQGAQAIASMIGVLKAGGFFLPLDTSAPMERNAKIVAASGAQVILSDAANATAAQALCTHGQRVVFIETAFDEASVVGQTCLRHCDHTRPAYVLYTSGSTGKPKGVLQDHGHVLHNSFVHTEGFEITPADRQSLLYRINVYGGLRDTFNALLNGACLYVLTVNTEEMARLPEWLAENEITIYCSVATIFRHLVRCMPKGAIYPSVRVVKLGGEVVYASDIESFARIFDAGCKLSCGLAMTETGAVSQYFVDAATSKEQSRARLGEPVSDTIVDLLDEKGQPVPQGEIGEIVIRSRYISRGYWKSDALSEGRFFTDTDGTRSFYTGDLGKRTEAGEFIHAGRKDFQVKIRGNRVDLMEVEQAILQSGLASDAAVMAKEDPAGQTVLVAYLQELNASVAEMRAKLVESLPDYMIPVVMMPIDKIPLTSNGKKDRKQLPEPDFSALHAPVKHATARRMTVEAAWAQVLLLSDVPKDRNFFEIGGDSLKIVELFRLLSDAHPGVLKLTDLFQHSTVARQKALLKAQAEKAVAAAPTPPVESLKLQAVTPASAAIKDGIAIIGMSVRLPGADTLNAYWEMLTGGKVALQKQNRERLLARGASKIDLDDPRYVPFSAVIEDYDGFDTDYFGVSKAEARLMDPQHRLALECSVQALEDAAYTPATVEGDIGVFMSVGKNAYFEKNVRPATDILADVGVPRALLYNDRTYAATYISYRLGLSGPALHVDSACSGSAAAIHIACQSLRTGDCRMAIAGGARVLLPHGLGYLGGEIGVEAADGVCRPFDDDAAGTVFGSGAGVVLLKPLDEAFADGDHVYAVISGSGAANDANYRTGFSAPSVQGQTKAIGIAWRQAAISADDVDYVEAHGTGTKLGDPIEAAALAEALAGRQSNTPCRIGSVKGNLGHLSTAAGVLSVIKTALSLNQACIPASANYATPNSAIDFEASKLEVVSETAPWPHVSRARRAGVSSFGLGGTNVHLVMESAPAQPWRSDVAIARSVALVVSAASTEALSKRLFHLANALETNTLLLEDVAFSMAVGRTTLPYRAAVSGSSAADLAEALRHRTSDSARLANKRPKLVWMFPGQGAQSVDMFRDLYKRYPVFRDVIDTCSTHLAPRIGSDLRAIVFSGPSDGADEVATKTGQLSETRFTQPALFVFEYALARLWQSWGVVPDAMLGHSLGEYVAACLADVMTLEDALALIAKRGSLMQSAPAGMMLGVRTSEHALEAIAARHGVCIAAANAPEHTVLAGSEEAINAVAEELSAEGIKSRIVNAKHGFHSALMDPALAPFEAELKMCRLGVPRIPVISNVTGEPMTAEMTQDPEYWSRHLRSTVRFGSCMAHFENDENTLFLELGPGRVLSHLAMASGVNPDRVISAAALADSEVSDDDALSAAVAAAWEMGIDIDWNSYFAETAPRRIALPGYPFMRSRAWLGAMEEAAVNNISAPVPKVALESMQVGDVRTMVTKIWQSLLGCDNIAATDDFFSLGGDSMLLLRVKQSFDRRLKINLTLAELYQAATFEGLVHLVSDKLGADETPSDLGHVQTAATLGVPSGLPTPPNVTPPVFDVLADVEALMANAAQIPVRH